MTEAIRPLIAGNWKMNGLKASSAEFEAMLAGAGRVVAPRPICWFARRRR